MDIELLGQGFEAESKDSVGNRLVELLSQRDFHSFTAISAFASPAAINGIASHIKVAKKHLRNIFIVVGVDQRGTSKEALEALFRVKVKAFIFYQSLGTIFHPKIYLFEGAEKSELIIGSSNLTSHGLFANVETSILVSVNNKVNADRQIIDQLKNYFRGIFDLSDPNLEPLSKELIRNLVNEKIVPTEAERRSTYNKIRRFEKIETESIISKIFPKRALAKIPREFSGKQTKQKVIQVARESGSRRTSGPPLVDNLVWTRKELPKSSVQLSDSGTNPTGGLRLVQAKFEVNGRRINQTTYFRDTVFGHFNWVQQRVDPYVEAAIVSFEITIRGNFIGKHNLEVRHKPSGEAGQGNYTTSISWGDLSEIIRTSNLEGAKLDLYAPKTKSGSFRIDIT